MFHGIGVVPSGLKRRAGVLTGCGYSECKACYEPLQRPVCVARSLQDTKRMLDAMPGVLALWWFMENVGDDNPNRTELFFYCRERVRRYQADFKKELAFDTEIFEETKA